MTIQIGRTDLAACLIVLGGRTRWGDRILEDIRRGDVSFELVYRIALYGKSSFSGGALDDLKQMYKEQKEADRGCGGC